jgi:nucleolar pre-ribosomal-associated protein 2
MTQWNVENTLGAVAVMYPPQNTPDLAESSIEAFQWSCRFLEVIIKKHRRRLEGHYHILIMTMEALLRALVYLRSSRAAENPGTRAKLAILFTRLITLICEPTAASVTRFLQTKSLDSATDVAKRSAGRHMYLLLMLYVKLQLETDIPHDVRDALEQGVNSIFEIMPPEVRRILNDAMDASGRAILMEMFKRYTKFGKWSGV